MDEKPSKQSEGGKARAEKLSPEQRKAIAADAAAARWGNKPLRATHKGNFVENFGIDVDCYVLNDAQKTAVISQRGMARTLGLSKGGQDLPRFLKSKAMSKLVGVDLLEKFTQPLTFEWLSPGVEKPPGVIYGFDVALLIDICRVIIQAETAGVLGKRLDRVAAQAHIIVNASAKAGIKGLAYALAGYNPTTDEVIAAFKLYVQEEAKKYESEFPNELYMQWHRLYEIPVPLRGKPWQFKHLTVRHIYYPLAKSNGKIFQLVKALKAAGGNRQKKLFQFLSEVGTKALRFHIGRVAEMAEDSADKETYERKITKRFGDQQELELAYNDKKQEPKTNGE